MLFLKKCAKCTLNMDFNKLYKRMSEFDLLNY